MRKFTIIFVVSVLVPALQGYAKDPVLSRQLLQARYVALGFETASGFLGEWDVEALTSAKVPMEDREALDNVRDALRAWNRYAVTIDPRQAEILVAIRSGRLASATGGVRIHTGSDPTGRTTRSPGRGIGLIASAEVGPPNDYLAVYQANDGQEGPRLSRKSESDGLAGKRPALIESFKKDVESLAKNSKRP